LVAVTVSEAAESLTMTRGTVAGSPSVVVTSSGWPRAGPPACGALVQAASARSDSARAAARPRRGVRLAKARRGDRRRVMGHHPPCPVAVGTYLRMRRIVLGRRPSAASRRVAGPRRLAPPVAAGARLVVS